MKIGIIGNMNNINFSLARYLIDFGYDCELLLYNNESSHFYPSYDSFQDDYHKYCRQLTWGDPAGFLMQDFNEVKKDLEKYDFLIGNGPAPAYVTRIGRILDIFIPYGEDLYSLPFLKIVHPFRMAAYFTMAYYQRKGIQSTPYIIFDKTNKRFEKIFSRLKYTGKRIASPPPSLYHKEYEKEKLRQFAPANPFFTQLKKMREENDLIVLQHIRQMWRNVKDKWSIKGNDKLIKGFAEFLNEHPGKKSKLLLFEYGWHVPDTKKLIAELGITEHVIWFPRTPRKYIMHFIYHCDVVVGELHHSWLTYCVVMETLCAAKPLMHKRNDKDFKDEYTQLYPMLHADSPQTVSQGLKKVLNNKEEMGDIGIQGQKWFLEYCVDKPLAEVIGIIKRKKLDATHAYSF